MGGQNSKLTPEAEAMPPRIQSLLQRRFEELRNRTKAKKLKASTTTSNKKLLKEGEEIEDNSLPHSLLTSPEQLENMSKVVALTTQENELQDQNKDKIKRDEDDDDENRKAKGVTVYIGGVFALEEATPEEDEDNGEDQDAQRPTEIFMCPASPSFRVYCMEPQESENDDGNNYSTDDDKKHKKTSSAESASYSSDNSLSSTHHNNGQKEKKKGRRRRIRKALSIGGPNAVMNLLNVKGCYNPGCNGGHDRRAYDLDEKSAAT